MLSSLFLAATLAVGIDPSSASSGANLPVVTTKQSITAKQKLAEKVALQRPFHELDRQIVATLTQEALLAKQKDEPARAKSAVQLCDLHREVVGDTRFATSEVPRKGDVARAHVVAGPALDARRLLAPAQRANHLPWDAGG